MYRIEVQSPELVLTIGDVAVAAAVGVETIGFYHRKGLLPLPARPRGGIRRYGPGDAARVTFIKAAERLGFSLEEVPNLLALDAPLIASAEHEIGEQSAHQGEIGFVQRALTRGIVLHQFFHGAQQALCHLRMSALERQSEGFQQIGFKERGRALGIWHAHPGSPDTGS